MKNKYFTDIDDQIKDLPSDYTISRQLAGVKARATRRAKGLDMSLDMRDEIYYKQFKTYKRLTNYITHTAKRIGYDGSTILDICSNSKNTVTDEEHKKNVINWQNNVAWQYVIYSPGSDLVNTYDINIDRMNGNASLVPPGVIYDIRFNSDQKSDTIKRLVAPFYKHRPTDHKGLPKLDPAEVAGIRKKKFNWLTQSKSTKHIFYTPLDAGKFLQQKTGFNTLNDIYKYFTDKLYVGYSHKLAGWVTQLRKPGQDYII